MKTAQDFVNWLEGFLDACKNSPSPQQIREVRKKMAALPATEGTVFRNRSTGEVYNPLWNSQIDPVPADHFSTITLVQPDPNVPNNGQLDEEFIKAVEENKNASTMDELFS
jgi:hypothetical protein